MKEIFWEVRDDRFPEETWMDRKTEVEKAFENAKAFSHREVECYLSEYRTGARMMEMNEYERNYLGGAGKNTAISRETELYLKARMYEIRDFILSIEGRDEKLFLYYHYVHGESMMRCAELLAVSRATVYRIRKRALDMAAMKMAEGRDLAL